MKAPRSSLLRCVLLAVGLLQMSVLPGCTNLMKAGVKMEGGPQKDLWCWGGEYSDKEGPAEARIRDECIRACARYGYHEATYDVAPKVEPKDPDEDVKKYMPSACMP